MKNKNVILIILGILLFGLNVINNDLSEIDLLNETINEKIRCNLKSSGFWNLTGSPILIDGNDPSKNWSYTASQYAWCSGSGTWEAPYVIENVTVNGQGVGCCIEIRNSTEFFMIRNCSVYNSGSNYLEDGGIKLNNTKNGQIRESNCSNNQRDGILLTTNCSNINITSNLILNTGYGIRLLDGCFNNTVSFNYFYYGITLSGSSYNLITNNIMPIGGGGKIMLVSNSNYNVIKNNSIDDSSSTRKFAIENSRNNIISENSIRNIGEVDHGKISFGGGIDLMNANNTIISNNIVTNIGMSGIFGTGNNNTIEGNEINNTGGYGIWVEGNDNTFSKNSVVDNYIGIQSNGHNSVINDNYIALSYENGIFSWGSCNIFGNILTFNGWPRRSEGIRIVGNNSLIWNNTLANNWAGGIYLGGAYLQQSSYNNTIYENNITGRGNFDDFGIKLFRSNNNTISKNILTNHVFGLYLERSNYSNIFENVMVNNLKCIEEIDCIGTLYRDNSCDLDVISPAIPGYNISFLIGVMFFYAVIIRRRKFRSKH